MTTVPFPVHRDELASIPVFWAEAPEGLPFTAGVLFRVGRGDENVPMGGVTHLVEHLALPDRVPGDVQFNGTVDLTTTTFWGTGDREPVLEFLDELMHSIRDLPLGRLTRERSILHTEAASREHGYIDTALMLRYGAQGPGLAWIDEFGLNWLGREHVAAWANEWFTDANCALYFTGAPPKTLSASLPSGRRRVPAGPEAIDYVRFPSVFGYGPPGGVAIALPSRRSSAFKLAMDVLVDRVTSRLRHRHGLTYETGSWFEPLTRDLAHAVIWIDCLPENIDAARSALLTELDELAHRGPTDAEREADLREFDQAQRDPGGLPSKLFWYAQDELLGGDFRSEAELRAERAALTGDEIAQRLAEAANGLLLIIPEEGTPPAGRFVEYQIDPPYRVEGTRFRLRGLPLRRKGTERELVIGDDGVTLGGVDYVRTVRLHDLEAVLRWADGSRTLCGRDATFLTVDPDLWRSGQEAVRQIDAAVPSERVVVMQEAETDLELEQASQALERGDHEHALRLLSETVTRRSDDAVVYGMLAASYAGLERWADTLAAAEQACELDPSLEWGHTQRALALWHVGRHDAAVAAVRDALDLGPSDLEALANFAWLASEAGEEVEARRAADRAVELYPNDDQAWFARGLSAMRFGEWELAETALRRAIELQPGMSMWHNNLGWLLLQQGRTREAARAFDRALKLDGRNKHARFNAIAAQREQGRVEQADAARTQLLEEELERLNLDEAGGDPNQALIYANTLSQLGRVREAAGVLEAVLERVPERNEALTQLAQCQVDLGELDQARQSVERAAALEPAQMETLYVQGYVALAARDGDLAETAAEAAERLHPTHRLTSDLAGYAAVCREDWSGATECFRRTLEQSPLRCCSRAWLAIALGRVGRDAEAREHAALARRRCLERGACLNVRSLAEAGVEPARR